MAEKIEFHELQRAIAEKKSALGLGNADDSLFRNSGLRRTAEKRAFLARIEERCRQAGVAPVKANY